MAQFSSSPSDPSLIFTEGPPRRSWLVSCNFTRIASASSYPFPCLFSGADFALTPPRDEPFGLAAVEFGRVSTSARLCSQPHPQMLGSAVIIVARPAILR